MIAIAKSSENTVIRIMVAVNLVHCIHLVPTSWPCGCGGVNSHELGHPNKGDRFVNERRPFTGFTLHCSHVGYKQHFKCQCLPPHFLYQASLAIPSYQCWLASAVRTALPPGLCTGIGVHDMEHSALFLKLRLAIFCASVFFCQ